MFNSNLGTFTMEGGWIFDNTAPTSGDHHPGGTFNNNLFNPANGAIGNRPPDWVPPPSASPAPSTPRPGISVVVNGTPVEFDQPPIVESGRALVPLRAIFEALGAEVDWDQPAQTVTAVRGGITISLRIGSNVLVRNGQNIELDVPARVINNRTLVPVRAVSESFGAKVDWNQAEQRVTVTE